MKTFQRLLGGDVGYQLALNPLRPDVHRTILRLWRELLLRQRGKRE